jgi:hypothetical protein
MGRTLEVNHVSVDEAVAGVVARPSTLPDQLPQPEKIPGLERLPAEPQK